VKFLANGPDIPDDLVAAQERGQVIFVCGAGVSKTVGLPLFRDLVQDIYRSLGEDWTLHPAEREMMAEGGRLFGQYDRMLRCLERRLAGSQASRSLGMHKRIRTAVQDALKPRDDVDLANHAALLKLSRNAADDVRLVTTNFDTLFERSWREKYSGDIRSHAGAAMPQPKSARCTGVLHLHGRIEDKSIPLEETDLVITSAEFGDAYLRAGWASRYIYDLVRAYTVVLVGYEAEDPPMRYLLEALEADRERFTDLQKVYAFASHTSGDEALQSAIWKSKAVEPLLYQVIGSEHSALYDSIREWQCYADDPTVWRKQQLRPLLAREPKDLDPDTMDRCIHLLSHGDATQLLKELTPSASWLPVLTQRRAFDKVRTTPGEWIGTRINDAQMIMACSGLAFVDDEARWYIERAMEREKESLTPVRKKAWRLILASNRKSSERRVDERWFQIMGRIRHDYAEFATRKTITDLLRPRLVIEQPLDWFDADEDDEGPEQLKNLLRISFEPERYADPVEILSKWPTSIEAEVSLFVALARALTDALEEAEDLSYIGDWDHADADVPSVGRHPQNEHRYGFYPITRVLADLWDRVASVEPTRLRRYVEEWGRSRFLLLKRLALYGMTSEAFTSLEVAEYLATLDDDTFWIGNARVEIMRLIVTRWPGLATSERDRIEARIRIGVPRDLYQDFDDENKWTSIHDSSIYRRLARLKGAGFELSAAGNEKLNEIASRHPSWRPSEGDRDDFSSWHETWRGPIGNPERLKGVADEQVVQAAFTLQREHSFDEGDVWRKFCASDPERALRGLVSEAEAGRWEPAAWRGLLWEVGGPPSYSTLIGDIATRLIDMPDVAMSEILGAATSWVRTHGKSLSATKLAESDLFLRVWDRLAQLTYEQTGADKPEDDDDNDFVSRSLNRPGGQLAWALQERFLDAKPVRNGGFGDQLEPRFTRLVLAKGAPGILARVHLMQRLGDWDLISPEWTARFLLPLLEWSHPEAPAMWRAYAPGRIGTARLFNGLKPAMIRAFERPDMSDHDLEGLIGRLLNIGIWHRRGEGPEYLLEDKEVRRILTVGPRTVLQHVSWFFWRTMADANDEMPDKGERWRKVVGPFFRAIWPLDANLRSENVSSNLVEMAAECQSAFPDAVEAIVDVVVSFEIHKIALALKLEPHHESLPREHPASFLKLVNALVDPDRHRIPSDLAEVLEECKEADPTVVDDSAYRRLFGLRRLRSA
jgi:NAD-dependent SIR2 family protein deacetylase